MIQPGARQESRPSAGWPAVKVALITLNLSVSVPTACLFLSRDARSGLFNAQAQLVPK